MTEEEYFRKNYPDSCYGNKLLSPYWDFFQDGVEFGERQSEKRIEELEEKISVLLSCKNCPDNKGGFICQKEYEDKCLAQKIQFIKELQEENAELKAVERMALYSKMSDRLARAEELLLELYDCIPSSMADSCKDTLQKVALFFKDSEVEK